MAVYLEDKKMDKLEWTLWNGWGASSHPMTGWDYLALGLFVGAMFLILVAEGQIRARQKAMNKWLR